jgi:UDP-glucose 4-epimerase
MKINGLNILVTGGAGFIGSHIVDDLVNQGANVTIYDNFSSGSMENISHLCGKIKIIKGNILDYNKLNHACENMDVISHQAAQLEITKCMDDPIEDLKINTEGSLNVLNSAVDNDVKKILYASSACVYGQAEYLPENENHPHNPNWPYGVSKLAVEKYANIYHENYDISTIGLRYSIIYGPKEWYGRVLTVFLKRALENKPPVVWGGDQIRDFCYVKDLVEFHNILINKDQIENDVFNVSTGVGTKIKDLADLIKNYFNLDDPIYENIGEGEISNEVTDRKRLPLELKEMVLDNSKAKRVGWKPKVKLEEGILKEYEWLKENHHRWTNPSY